MSEENKTLIYAELQSGTVGGYVTDYSQIKNAPNKNVNVEAVDTSETLDDVETNTYVKYIAQTLTDTQKQQVRENIGAASSDDIFEFRKDGDGTQFLSNDGTYKTLYTTTEIDSKLGDINTILESIING